MGLAILLALPWQERKKFLSSSLQRKKRQSIYNESWEDLDEQQQDLMPPEDRLLFEEQMQSVVIIDEVDKAPRDFPNDLLHELDNMRFRVPELKGLETSKLDERFKPIVFITTNSERQLPNAFLRRCAYIHVEYPTGPALREILVSRIPAMYNEDGSGKFIDEIQNFYEDLRRNSKMDKAPATAELVQFCRAIQAQGADPDLTIHSGLEYLNRSISILSKTKRDSLIVSDLLSSNMIKSSS